MWQWKGDEDQWEPYPPSVCSVLDSAMASGKTSVTVSLGSGREYEVDLKKMVQINPVTKYKRKIRPQTLKTGGYLGFIVRQNGFKWCILYLFQLFIVF